MPDDRSRSSRGSSGGTSGGGGGRNQGGSRGSSNTPNRSTKPGSGPRKPGAGAKPGSGGKPGSGPRKPGAGAKPGSGGKPGSGPRKPGAGGKPGYRGKPGSGRSDPRSGSSSRSGASRGGSHGNRDDWREEREPRNEAERRAAEVRATRGPRRTPRTEENEQAKIEARTVDQWVDEGSVRDAATDATRRAGAVPRSPRRDAELDPSVAAEIHGALPSDRAKRLTERLASASAALDRERFEEARRMVTPLAKELPQVAAVHEVGGLASYRLGRWREAATSLELARQLHPDPSLLPVLADCYRALGRWNDVDDVWDQLKAASPPHDVMAEGRIVAASALADRGDLADAIKLMSAVAQPPKRVRDHHLRQWYVLADLYDRAGDTLAATRWFREVAANDPQFADVSDRLRTLGR